MIETNAPFRIDTGKQSYAIWADASPRRGLISSAIIRVRPLVLLHVGLLLCAVSGAGAFLVATYALGATI